VKQTLGRDLSGGAANVSVNLVAPATLYADRRNNFDFRVAKIVRYGRTRAQLGIDVYNLTNTDVVTSYNQTFVPGGSWLTPTGIQPARYVKLNAQIDF
jgi:outer membrane receptor protein involved in Fe transport